MHMERNIFIPSTGAFNELVEGELQSSIFCLDSPEGFESFYWICTQVGDVS